MKITEEFVIDESSDSVWEFFEQLEQVARCVPGVEEIAIVDADNSRVRVTQALGPMSATFDVKMRITARDPGRSMEFTAVGRSVKGAAGNVRATHVVTLEDRDESSTRVSLEGDVALGGMLGSVGQKVVAKQASLVTQSFAQALQERLSGRSGAEDDTVSAVAEPPEPPVASGPSTADQLAESPGASPARSGGRAHVATRLVVAAAALAVLLFVARWLRSRSTVALR